MQQIYFLIYITYLFLIIFLIFFDRKKPMLRFSWILLLVLVPVIGLFLYLIFGTNGLYVYKNSRIRKRHGDLLEKLEKMNTPHEIWDRPQSAAERFHTATCGAPATTDNDVEIFTNGAAKFERLFADLAAAQDHIHVQYFTIENDGLSKELLRVLAAKARDGVEVKLLYDTIGSLLSCPRKLFREAAEAGVQVASIRSLLFDLNYRNHRKLVVIDGKIGYAGGMNFGAKYRDGVRGKPWRDTHLRLTGSAVHRLQQVFISDWITSVQGSDVGLRHELSHYFPTPAQREGFAVQVVANSLFARFEHDSINLGYLNLISRAERRVWIQTPYFVPSETMLQTLKALAKLGVDVRIIISSTYASGGPFHRGIANYFLRYLAAYGVKVYRYDGVMHAKTLLVDEDKLCVGSVNMNTRSLERDDELYVYMESAKLAGAYEVQFRADLERSSLWDVDAIQEGHLGARVMESLMSLLAPLA